MATLGPVRNLLIVLGDQLDRKSAIFRDADRARDVIWMAEVREESTHVRSHKVRTALFLSAMRHYRDELFADDWRVEYHEIDDRPTTLANELAITLAKLRPAAVRVVQPGEWRVLDSLRQACPSVETIEDEHFLATIADFAHHARGRKQLRMEFFYREVRRRYGILMSGSKPEGGEWNYDAQNRGSFGRAGPGLLPQPARFVPDAVTQIGRAHV